jgi:hypothetical protein
VQLTVVVHDAGWSSAAAEEDAAAVRLGPFDGSVVFEGRINVLRDIQHGGQLSPYLGSCIERTHEVVLAEKVRGERDCCSRAARQGISACNAAGALRCAH